MARTVLGSTVQALAGCILLLATAPAHAAFDVVERGRTTTVTQLDAARLMVIVNFGGGLVLNDGVSVIGYPPMTNLVVRGHDALTPSELDIVIHQALPGSLTLDLPGASDVTVRGTAATIEGALNVKGSDAAGQTIRLGVADQPVTIEGSVKLDLKKGHDQVQLFDGTTILGTFTGKGVNSLRATSSEVGGSFSIDGKRDSHGIDMSASGLVVGKAFTVSGGPADDVVVMENATIGKSVKVKLGDGSVAGTQTFGTGSGFNVGGSFTAQLGVSSRAVMAMSGFSVVKGSVNVVTRASYSNVQINGEIGGTSIKFTGGDGDDEVRVFLTAPRAKGRFDMGAGGDLLAVSSLGGMRLDVDFGPGSDRLEGFVPPPGTVIGLP